MNLPKLDPFARVSDPRCAPSPFTVVHALKRLVSFRLSKSPLRSPYTIHSDLDSLAGGLDSSDEVAFSIARFVRRSASNEVKEVLTHGLSREKE